MATRTPLHHPKSAAQGAQFFPHNAVFKGTGANGQQTTIFESKCAYEPVMATVESSDFEYETPANDRILLPAWHPEVAPDQLVVLSLDGATKRFKVLDFAPDGNPSQRTLVILTPKK